MIEKTEDREFTITNKDGSISKVMGKVTTIDHQETDKDGNPKISTKINIPVASVGAKPGKNGE